MHSKALVGNVPACDAEGVVASKQAQDHETEATMTMWCNTYVSKLKLRLSMATVLSTKDGMVPSSLLFAMSTVCKESWHDQHQIARQGSLNEASLA